MKIVFTGGGTAGHVIPNIALIEELKGKNSLFYIGADGLEKQLLKPYVENQSLRFFSIEAHKLVRSLTPKNLLLPFRLIKSVSQARKLLSEIKPDLVFSKGGYVALPVVIAARSLKIRCILHESDMSLGLSNKIGSHYADKVLTTFEPPAHNKKAVKSGAPIRQNLYTGDRARGLKTMGFDGSRPVVLVMGGSLGAAKLNETVRELKNTLSGVDIFVICGKGKTDKSLDGKHFRQVEFVTRMKDIFAASDVCVSRGGANSLCELASLQIPFVVVPLSKNSRGEQLENARFFQNEGCGLLLEEDSLNEKTLNEKIGFLLDNKQHFKHNQSKLRLDGTSRIINEINSFVH